MTHHWIHTLDSVGRVDLTTADYALTNVFVKGNCKHYVIYNPKGNPSRTVNFSDGNSFTVLTDTLQVFYKCPDPLPVTLLSFEGIKIESGSLLSWKTFNEINAKEFIIERSTDGIHFIKIGVQSSGSSYNYSFVDQHPFDGINYYRLKIIDNDDSYQYSPIIALQFKEVSAYIFPNPADDILHIAVRGNSDFKIELYNNLGQLIISQNNSSEIDLSNLAAGIYNIKILLNDQEVLLKKLFVNE